MFSIVEQHQLMPSSSAPAPFWSSTQGKRATRVQLKGYLADPHFFIRIMDVNSKECFIVRWIKRLHAYCWYTTMQVDNKDVLFNINSLAKRLRVSSRQIREAKKNGILEQLIESRSCLSFLPQTLHENYIIRNNGRMLFKATKQYSNINFDTLFKISEAIKSHFSNKDNSQIPQLKEEGICLIVDQKEFLFAFNKDKFHIILYTHAPQDELGEGATATVYKVLNIAEGKFQALKQLKNPEVAELKDSMFQEITALQHLSEQNKKKHPYFQSAPTCSFDIKATDSNPAIAGTLGELYPGQSLLQWLKGSHPPAERIEMCRKLITAVHLLLSELKICHPDLKPENFVLNADGAPVMIDFPEIYKIGGSNDSSAGGTGSPQFLSQADCDALIDLQSDLQNCTNEEERIQVRKEIDDAVQKRVLFSTGALCFETLSGGEAAFKIAKYEIPSREILDELFKDEALVDGILEELETTPFYKTLEDFVKDEALVDGILEELETTPFYKTLEDLEEHRDSLEKRNYSPDVITFIQNEIIKKPMSYVPGNAEFRKEFLNNYSDELINLIRHMVDQDPSKRPKIEDVVEAWSKI